MRNANRLRPSTGAPSFGATCVLLGAAALVACVESPTAPGPEAALESAADQTLNGAYVFDYLKTETGGQTGIWTGTIGGASVPALSRLRTELTGPPRVTGAIWHISTMWTVDAGPLAFTADMRGIVNTKTGALLLNGTITSGPLTGAQAHADGVIIQVLASGATVFEGQFKITPSS